MDAIPILPGIWGLATEGDDIKSKAFWVLGGMLIVSLIFESLGYSQGPLASQVISAFPLVLAYLVGQKDSEVKVR